MKISEVSEFSILPYTENRKLIGNLGKVLLLQNLAVVVTKDSKITKNEMT